MDPTNLVLAKPKEHYLSIASQNLYLSLPSSSSSFYLRQIYTKKKAKNHHYVL
jgi:hypothetical protein